MSRQKTQLSFGEKYFSINTENCEQSDEVFSSGIFSQYIILVRNHSYAHLGDDDGKNRERRRVGWGSCV